MRHTDAREDDARVNARPTLPAPSVGPTALVLFHPH